MKSNLIVGIIITLLIVSFLLWGISYHQPQCLKDCEGAEERLEKNPETGKLQNMTNNCHEVCEYFLFDGKQIWFFNWRIK